MRNCLTLLLVGASLVTAAGPLELVSAPHPQIGFAGETRPIEVWFRNRADRAIAVPLRYRVFLQGSDVAMPLGGAVTWKVLQVLGGQTVVETVSVALPTVKREARLHVQWLDSSGTSLGATEVRVVPHGLLAELGLLAGDRAVGLVNPTSALKAALSEAGVAFTDLLDVPTDNCEGRLVIAQSNADPEEAARVWRYIGEFRQRRVSVLWFKPAAGADLDEPPTVVLCGGEGTLVIARNESITELVEDPAAQDRLLSLARLAVKPEQFPLTPFLP